MNSAELTVPVVNKTWSNSSICSRDSIRGSTDNASPTLAPWTQMRRPTGLGVMLLPFRSAKRK